MSWLGKQLSPCVFAAASWTGCIWLFYRALAVCGWLVPVQWSIRYLLAGIYYKYLQDITITPNTQTQFYIQCSSFGSVYYHFLPFLWKFCTLTCPCYGQWPKLYSNTQYSFWKEPVKDIWPRVEWICCLSS